MIDAAQSRIACMLTPVSSAYYIERGRRPKNCRDCDGLTACKCSRLRIRSVKRGARAVWRERMRDEERESPLDYYRDLAADALAVRALFVDLATPAGARL